MFERIRVLVATLVVALITLSAGSAFADGVGTVAKANEQTRLMSLTFSPLRLLSPTAKLAAEFKAEDQWTVAVVGGFGTVSEGEDAEGTTLSHDVWEIGGQARYYALGNFDHGLNVGLEVLFRDVPVESTGLFNEVTEGTARGLAMGPFVGYKIITEVGLTFDVQAGARYDGFDVLAEAEQVDDLETPDEQDLHPMVNLNVGWSF